MPSKKRWFLRRQLNIFLPQFIQKCQIPTGKNDINVLEVKCTNFERGCKWVGAIIMFENHLENCGYHLVECPLGCKITGLLQHALDKHIKRKCPNREFYCQDCNFKDTYENITNAHELQCQKKIILCPNPRCPESMEREKVNSHIEKECDYTMVTCKYESIGCEKKLEKYLMKEHEQDISSHIPLALTTLIKFQKYQQIATQSIESAHEAIRSLKFAIKSLTDIILVLKNRNDTPILNQGEAFTFKLTQFALKINTNNEFCSHPFYTSHRGYNMTIITNLRGGDGCDISVYVRMLQGEHDKELEWPFIGRVTFELLNQLADRKHHVKIINVGKDDDMQVSKGMGVTQFISHALLEYDPAEHTQYLKDDTLYFRITVESHSFKPWLECTTN